MIKHIDNVDELLEGLKLKSEKVKKMLSQKYSGYNAVDPKESKKEKELKFLIVEDDLNDEFLMLRQLNILKHYNVEVARHGYEALHYLFEGELHYPSAHVREKFDMIFLDLQMPIMDGLEFLEIASESLSNSGIPVVVTTSSIQEKNITKCEYLGAKAYLRKPITASDLYKVINSSINHS